MDNAKTHYSTNYYKLKEKIKIVLNTPYSPQFNPIELINKILKQKVYKKHILHCIIYE